MIRAGMAQSAESPLSAETILREGQILTGPLFAEPTRVETVRPNGSDTWVAGLVGLRSEQFRRVTLTSGDLSNLTIADTALSYEKFLALKGGGSARSVRGQPVAGATADHHIARHRLAHGHPARTAAGAFRALVIVDEAHRMSALRREPQEPARSGLGRACFADSSPSRTLPARRHDAQGRSGKTIMLFRQLLDPRTPTLDGASIRTRPWLVVCPANRCLTSGSAS